MKAESPRGGDSTLVRLRRVAPQPTEEGGAPGRLSFSIERGGAHVLTGGPKSGKSAVLEMIALARPPAQGGLEIFGRDVTQVRRRDRFAIRRRIGFMFQNLRLIDTLSAFDNIAIAALAGGREPAGYIKDIGELLSWVGLARWAAEPAGGFSDEGRRRIALARAVINRPDLLIADEPAAGAGLPILKLLSELNRTGTTLLIATSDDTLVDRLGGDVIRIDQPPRPQPPKPPAPDAEQERVA